MVGYKPDQEWALQELGPGARREASEALCGGSVGHSLLTQVEDVWVENWSRARTSQGNRREA